MPAHSDRQHFPYPAADLFALVADVERYPEFLPWVRAVRITERHPDYFVAELAVCFKHITEQYTSKVLLTPAPDTDTPARIDVELISGPFDYLENHWQFEPAADGGTLVHFQVDFRFKSKWLDTLIGGLFNRATQKMVSAFSDRAHALCGQPRI